jgi:hypothetical protein
MYPEEIKSYSTGMIENLCLEKNLWTEKPPFKFTNAILFTTRDASYLAPPIPQINVP